jgi:hypothetical protein
MLRVIQTEVTALSKLFQSPSSSAPARNHQNEQLSLKIYKCSFREQWREKESKRREEASSVAEKAKSFSQIKS